MTPRHVLLVEGVSDAAALHALAARRGRDLVAERVEIRVTGGAHGTARHLRGVAAGSHVTVLCDAAEAPVVRGQLAVAGRAAPVHVCDRDLEDELIRAAGVQGVQDVLAANDDLARFRGFQRQPDQAGREVHAQLRRFMGTRAGRKERYARLLVEALPGGRVPAPLDAALAATARP